jgi:predicted RNase H-like nuclease (RuvC/YqgF family)
MSEENKEQVMGTAERLASAAEALDRVLAKLDAQQEALNAKVDRIVAAVEERETERSGQDVQAGEAASLQKRVTELEKANEELKAQASRITRKTLSPLVSTLLAKNAGEEDRVDAATLDKTLQALSVEQRIAVKAEMARAGMIE